MSTPDIPRPPDGPEATQAVDPRSLPASRRRDPRFRSELLGRLPRLGYSSWSAREDFQIDREWGGIVSLGSDAVLGPLEPLHRP